MFVCNQVTVSEFEHVKYDIAIFHTGTIWQARLRRHSMQTLYYKKKTLFAQLDILNVNTCYQHNPLNDLTRVINMCTLNI